MLPFTAFIFFDGFQHLILCTWMSWNISKSLLYFQIFEEFSWRHFLWDIVLFITTTLLVDHFAFTKFLCSGVTLATASCLFYNYLRWPWNSLPAYHLSFLCCTLILYWLDCPLNMCKMACGFVTGQQGGDTVAPSAICCAVTSR